MRNSSAQTWFPLASAAFGQTFTVTPIALVTAEAAAVNGGYLHQPYIVQEVLDSEGNVTYEHDATQVRQVVSEETSKRVCALLEGVVDGGTGKNAYVSGYRIGGKPVPPIKPAPRPRKIRRATLWFPLWAWRPSTIRSHCSGRAGYAQPHYRHISQRRQYGGAPGG